MPRIAFTPNLARHIDCPAQEVAGDTVARALDLVFVDNPRLRGYIVDEQGRVRQHVAIFVDGAMIRDRMRLSDRVAPNGEIFVMQALSGG